MLWILWSIPIVLGLGLVVFIAMIGNHFFGFSKPALRGPYAFDATGDFEGHFSGMASADYTHPLSGAGYHYNIVLPLDLPPVESRRYYGLSLMFILAEKPATGTIILKETPNATTPRALLGGRTDRPISWVVKDGELRIERDPKGGPGLEGEFRATLVQLAGGPSTNTTQIKGRFDTR